MKALVLLVSILLSSAAWGGSADNVYLYIELIEGDEPLLIGSASGGCTVAPGGDCNGLFYRGEDCSGMQVGGIINEDHEADFELLFSSMVVPTDSGQDLIVSTYMMSLGADGTILEGKKSLYREAVEFGDQVVMPVGSFFGDDPIFLSIKVGNESDPPWGHQTGDTYQVQLISTNVGPAETITRRTSHRRQLSPRLQFSSDFRDVAADKANHKSLRYHVQVYLEGWQDGAPGSECTLRYKRQYLIDSSHTQGNQTYAINAKFQSEYERTVQISPDKMIKLVFPPDQPSVHGFDIEDTLVIYLDDTGGE
jgi:hypothetical protein